MQSFVCAPCPSCSNITTPALINPTLSGLTPTLKLKPGYAPPQPLAPAPALAPAPGYAPQAPYVAPQPAYTPEPYSPPAPVGPVLLESKPYDPKSVEALPITVAETYTNFDCRSKPYPGRHYADVEAGCEVRIFFELNKNCFKIFLFSDLPLLP